MYSLLEDCVTPPGLVFIFNYFHYHGLKPVAIIVYGPPGPLFSSLSHNFICSSSNVELVKSLGADVVLDYLNNDLLTTGEKFDVIFDTVGKFPKSKAKSLLFTKGRYISTHSSPVKENQEYLYQLKELAERDHLKPVIDKNYPLEKIQEAHAYVETGHKKGNVIINV